MCDGTASSVHLDGNCQHWPDVRSAIPSGADAAEESGQREARSAVAELVLNGIKNVLRRRTLLAAWFLIAQRRAAARHHRRGVQCEVRPAMQGRRLCRARRPLLAAVCTDRRQLAMRAMAAPQTVSIRNRVCWARNLNACRFAPIPQVSVSGWLRPAGVYRVARRARAWHAGIAEPDAATISLIMWGMQPDNTGPVLDGRLASL